MDTIAHSEAHDQIREPWNKGKITGAKPPLRPKHVWAVRTRLQLSGRFRDLALFNLAIDSKLRGCDVVTLKIVDVAPHGYALDRASVLTMIGLDACLYGTHSLRRTKATLIYKKTGNL
jgi:hypothetical protein